MTGGRFIGGIRFGVSMSTKKLKKDTKDAQSLIRRFVGTTEKALKPVALLGSASAAAFGVMVKSQFDAVDSLAKVSDKLGITTEALAGMRHAANQTGVATATLDTAMQRMVRRVSDAASGFGEARGALKELGLDAKELNKLSPDRQFARISEQVRKLNGQSEKVRLAFKLFDSEGVALVNTLKLGSKGLASMSAEAKTLGLSISRIEAQQIEAANDAVDKMQKAFVGVARATAVKLAPVVTDVSDQIRAWVTQANKAKSVLTSTANVRGGFLGGVLDVANLLKTTFLGVRNVVTGLISQAVKDIDMLAKFIGRLVRKLERLPGIGSTAGKIANSLENGFLDSFNRNMQRQSKMASQAFWDSFMSKTPTERIARTAAKAVQATKPKQNTAFDSLKRFGGAALGLGRRNLASFGQAANGIQNSPALRLLLQSVGPYLKSLGSLPGNAAQAFQGSRGTLAFAESGSAESFRQRARIRNQRDSMKIQEQQLQVQKDIRDQGKNGVQLAPAGLNR